MATIYRTVAPARINMPIRVGSRANSNALLGRDALLPKQGGEIEIAQLRHLVREAAGRVRR